MLRSFALALMLCLSFLGVARAELVSPAFRAAILLRSLGYERGVAARSGPLVIVVVSGPSERSQTDARDMVDSFRALASRMQIGSGTISLHRIEHRSTAETRAQLRVLAPAAAYFTHGLEALTTELSAGAENDHWVPMCADGSAMGEGCAIGARVHGDASQLVVNLKRAQRLQLSFDARMLRLSHVLH